jgi:hypothetical protein
MTRPQEESELVRRFLLGDLDERRREQLEERMLTNAELQEQVSATRVALIDEYAFGLMDGRELELFESNFSLTPDQTHELHLSKALRRYVEMKPVVVSAAAAMREPAGSSRFSLRWAALAVAVVVAAICYGGWAVYHNRQIAARLEQLRSQRLQVEQELAGLNGRKFPAADDPSIISLSPLSDLDRSVEGDGGVQKSRAIVNEGKNFLLLNLRLAEGSADSNSYHALIQTDDGADIYTVNELRAVTDSGHRTVKLLLPGRLLPTGSYQVKIVGDTGRESDAVTYPFQVVQK